MPPKKNSKTDDRESQVWSAITVFEQIVQQIPNDRVSLEALSHAYEQLGDHTRAQEYLIRLANVVVDEQDRAAADTVLERLRRFGATEGPAAEAEARIQQFLSLPDLATPRTAPPAAVASPGVRTQAASAKSAEALNRASPVPAELSFAWTLFQAGELNQEEYSNVAHDLTELSAADTPVTVSLLHVLQDRSSRHIERIMLYAARQCGVPVIPLAAFDPQHDAFALMPLVFMIRQGAIAFELLGKDALVAILNPYNQELRKDVETLMGRRCHFFLALPAEFDTTLETIRNRLDADAESAARQPTA